MAPGALLRFPNHPEGVIGIIPWVFVCQRTSEALLGVVKAGGDLGASLDNPAKVALHQGRDRKVAMTACCWACSTIALFLEILRSAHKQKMQRPSPAHACAEPTSETVQTETTALRR